MKHYKRLHIKEDTDNKFDPSITKILKYLRDNDFGNELSRKSLMDKLTSLHNSNDPRARKALKAIGDMFTDIGNEILKYGVNTEEINMKRYKRKFEEAISKDLEKDVLNRPIEFRYQMLGRFISDADYFFRNPSPKHLWAGDPIEHADNMLTLYNTFKGTKKPTWLTDKQLKDYIKKLKSMGN